MSRDRLGKGLGALLGEYLDPEAQPGEIEKLPLVAIVPNPVQPRRVFNAEELEDLTSSIRENGLLQPLVVRPAPGSADRYELIAGERRFRALMRLEWAEAPVMIREASDETLLVLALVENLQREALNPLEEAEGYEALAEKHGMKQAEIAKAVGKDRSTVANLVRLLKLPLSIRKLIEAGSLTPGHARALLTLEDPIVAAELARRAAKEGWSVREVERRAAGSITSGRSKTTRKHDPVVEALERALEDHLQTRVEVKPGRSGKGTVQLVYHSADDFDRLFELLTGASTSDVVG